MSNKNPKILYITSHCPHASTYGAQQRVLNIGRLLKRIGHVSMVIASFEEVDEDSLNRTRDEFDVRQIVRVNPSPLNHYSERVRFELDPSFLKTHFLSVHEHDREDTLRLIPQYDVIWVHSIRTANYFQIYRWPNTVLDIDDVQSRFYKSKIKHDQGLMRNLLDYRMSVIWRRRERHFLARFDALAVCSEHDRRYFGADTRIHVIPNGFPLPSSVPDPMPAVPARLGFIGLFQYEPNRNGLEWFIRNVWPRIKREAPDTRLRLVGKGSDKEFPRMGPDIEGLGYVDNPTAEIATWSAMIVPIRTGGGTRIKIAEAFSRKCPVVSTSLGAFGYQVVDGEDLLLADGAEEFAAACVRLVKQVHLGQKLSESAWKKYLNNWTWDSIGESVSNTVKQCLTRSRELTEQSDG